MADTRVSIWQSGKSENSITLSVSGVVTARRTEIFIWEIWEWMDLNSAKAAGYIDFYTNGGANDDIEIIFATLANVSRNKVWDFCCYDIGEATRKTAILHAIIGFSFENTKTKEAGQPVDLTWKDIDYLNRYAMQMNDYILQSSYTGTFYSFTEADTEKEVKAVYVKRLFDVIRLIWTMYKKETSNTKLLRALTIETILDKAESDIESKKDVTADVCENCIKKILDTFRMRVFSDV